MLRGFKSSALPLKLIPVLHWIYSPIFSLYPCELQLAMNIFIKKQTLCIYWPIFYLFPRALQFAMTIIIKKQKWENPGIDLGPSRMLIERSTTWANPPWEMILFTNLFLISSWVAICNEYNYKETEIGESGYRSRWLPNTNQALYQLS